MHGEIRSGKYAPSARSFIVLASFCVGLAGAAQAEDVSLLRGKVVSTDGQALAGVPIKAHRTGTNITVAVHSDTKGIYSFPVWSDLTPGSYTIKVELSDYEHVNKEGVAVAAGETLQLDLTLEPRTPVYEEATASEIVAALPGTDHQKTLLIQCRNCHSLQWALRTPHTRDEWGEIIIRMGGSRATTGNADTYAFNQQRFVEPLAEYLASIRGPGSSDEIPFKPRPRPTDEAATDLVVTEYDLPRGGHHDLYTLRGDTRFVWPHDVVLVGDYAYYTDHFSYALGRMNRKTGEVTELPFEVPEGAGRAFSTEERAGNPGGGPHDMAVDKEGNIYIGMANGTVRYSTKTGEFHGWPFGVVMFGIGPEDNLWIHASGGPLFELDTGSPELKLASYTIPKNMGIYDMDTDSRGRTFLNVWNGGKVAIYDPADESYAEYLTPTEMSGPRRGEIDAWNRLWVAEYFAGNILLFDADKKLVKEYPLVDAGRSYAPPYAMPYSTSVDNKNKLVWTNDFHSSRLFRFDMESETMTEYLTPSPYEIRDLTVDPEALRPTVWVPDYRPPSKLVKIQVR